MHSTSEKHWYQLLLYAKSQTQWRVGLFLPNSTCMHCNENRKIITTIERSYSTSKKRTKQKYRSIKYFCSKIIRDNVGIEALWFFARTIRIVFIFEISNFHRINSPHQILQFSLKFALWENTYIYNNQCIKMY